ncbi:hypothetical protein [Mucilaginibacter psychrotolerans]|uniref:Uncharacterized protein n=1 Tax=Mucilaginibacter psychrotolerans TaxID=1524096 RepID=A0A4Y8S3R0_9SPHI|nr:hypothetical protein [Mucilaginibacter psychrotolerans]TFF33295.1 hypothetical protein E2R66_26510 [Mucilaginibacter psychrotolerans]
MSKISLKQAFKRSTLLAALLVLGLSSCKKKMPFTRDGWHDGDGINFPNRYMMVEDLMATHKLKGMTYKQVVRLLHSPQRNSHTDKSFYYDITLEMKGIDTAYFKGLLFKLNADSVVTDVQVFEKTAKKKEK